MFGSQFDQHSLSFFPFLSFVLDDNRENASDQAKLIVGIVVGLLLAALVAGVAYWVCMKKSK